MSKADPLLQYTRSDSWKILTAITLLIYAQVVFFDKNIDDHLLFELVEGKIHTFSDLGSLILQPFNRVDYRPVPVLSLGIEYLLLGALYPAVSHMINLVLFIAILLTARHLLLAMGGEKHRDAIFLATALFACSTMNTEVVASIKSRDTLFSLLFTLLSLRFLIRNQSRYFPLFFLAGILFFLLALFSKRDSAGLVLFFPAYLLLRRETPMRQLLPSLIITALALFVAYKIRSMAGQAIIIPDAENLTYTGKVTFTENPLSADFNWSNRLAALFQTNLIYLGKLLFPTGLRYYYGYNHYTIHSLTDSLTWLALGVHALVLAAIYFLGRREPFIRVAALGYACFIVFALNFIEPNAGIVADRYAFQAGPWFWLGISLILVRILPAEQKILNWKTTGILLIIIYSCTSAWRTAAWKSPLTLLDRDVPHLQDSYEGMRIAANIYKAAYDTTGRDDLLQKAISCARQASAVYPANVYMHRYTAGLYFARNNPQAAILELNEALRHDSTDIASYIYLGDIYYAIRSYDQSATSYEKALGLAPRNPELINNLSTVYYEHGQKAKCLEFNLSLISKDSTLTAAWENLGYFYLAERDTQQAKHYFKLALKYGLSPETLPVRIK